MIPDTIAALRKIRDFGKNNGGGASRQRTCLCPKFPLTGKNTGKLLPLLIPEAFNASISLAFYGFSLGRS
jgi:hypothetical protein